MAYLRRLRRLTKKIFAQCGIDAWYLLQATAEISIIKRTTEMKMYA